MADWPGWWLYVRECVDRDESREVIFTIDAVRAGGRSFDRQLHGRGWWSALANPENTDFTGLIENGMACTPIPDEGPVERVSFERADQ